MAVNNSRRYRTPEPLASDPDKFVVVLETWDSTFESKILDSQYHKAKTMAQANKIKGDFEMENPFHIGRIENIQHFKGV